MKCFDTKCPQLHYVHITQAAIMPCFHLPVRYFTFPYQDMTLDQEMQLLDQPDKMCHFLAHNGWVMGDDPLKNFAEPGKQDEPHKVVQKRLNVEYDAALSCQ